jgi:hypothetical protein
MTNEVNQWHSSLTSEASGHAGLLDGVVVCSMKGILNPQIELKIALFILFLLSCPQGEPGLLKSIQVICVVGRVHGASKPPRALPEAIFSSCIMPEAGLGE